MISSIAKAMCINYIDHLTSLKQLVSYSNNMMYDLCVSLWLKREKTKWLSFLTKHIAQTLERALKWHMTFGSSIELDTYMAKAFHTCSEYVTLHDTWFRRSSAGWRLKLLKAMQWIFFNKWLSLKCCIKNSNNESSSNKVVTKTRGLREGDALELHFAKWQRYH